MNFIHVERILQMSDNDGLTDASKVKSNAEFIKILKSTNQIQLYQVVSINF